MRTRRRRPTQQRWERIRRISHATVVVVSVASAWCHRVSWYRAQWKWARIKRDALSSSSSSSSSSSFFLSSSSQYGVFCVLSRNAAFHYSWHKLFKHDFFRQNFISFCNKRREKCAHLRCNKTDSIESRKNVSRGEVCLTQKSWTEIRIHQQRAVSYTHLTLPTNREV